MPFPQRQVLQLPGNQLEMMGYARLIIRGIHGLLVTADIRKRLPSTCRHLNTFPEKKKKEEKNNEKDPGKEERLRILLAFDSRVLLAIITPYPFAPARLPNRRCSFCNVTRGEMLICQVLKLVFTPALVQVALGHVM